MKKRSSSIAVSKLARYASDPNSVFDKVDAGAVKYGNRAHNAIGAGPSAIKFAILAAALIAAAHYLGFILSLIHI